MEISKEEKRLLIIFGLILLVGMIFYLISHLPQRQKIDIEPIFDTPTQNETMAVPQDIFVHISGAVKNPGVYKLPLGSRIFEALEAAGGPLASADLDSINLTKKIEDEERIIVSNKNKEALFSSTQKYSTSEKININTASLQELDSLPKIGPATAQRIIDYRNKQSFMKIEEITKVKGIGKKLLEIIKDKIEI